MGHVVRCLALADVLGEMYGWKVSFVMRTGPLGIKEVRERGYVVHSPDQESDKGDCCWLSSLVSGISGDVLVCDVRDDLQKEELQDIRKKGSLVVLLDDLTERRLAGDMVFYPPIPQLDGLDWKEYTGRVFCGWEWIVLRRDLRNAMRTTVSHRPLLVVTMGACDPSGFTIKAVQALDYVQQEVDVIVVLGPGFCHGRELSEQTAKVRRTINVRTQVTNLPDLLVHADLVVGAFGTTAYELAVLGVPGIFLCASADHAESARAYMKAGFGISLGLGSNVNEGALAKTIDQEITRLAHRNLGNKGVQGEQVIDGFGAERVAEQIVRAIQERRKSHEAMAVS